MTLKRVKLSKLIFSAVCLAVSYVLPFLTGQIPEVGAMLCPLHIPVFVCGFVCGWQWGLAVGFVAPLFRALTLGMPPLFPTAVCMALELAAYGACCGLFDRLLPKRQGFLYVSLLVSMLFGRGVWGLAMLLCTGLASQPFGAEAFLAGAFTNALPGILLQILLVPPLVMLLRRMRFMHLRD